MEDRAQQLYEAISTLLHDHGSSGLLVAVGDARSRMPWKQTSPKTQRIFVELAGYLTEIERKATLAP